MVGPVASRMTPGSNVPDPLGRIVGEQRALAILRALDGEFGPMANDEVLSAYLPHIGLGCGRGTLRECLGALGSAGLIEVEERGSLLVLHLTRAGGEVAKGLARCDGVAVPLADCPY